MNTKTLTQLALLFLLGACGTADDPEPLVTSPPPVTEKFSLQMQLFDAAGRTSSDFLQGATITSRLTVTSIIDEEFVFRFDSGYQYDLRVDNEQGEPVWLWSSRFDFHPDPTTFSVAPGRPATVTWIWDQDRDCGGCPDAEPGSYTMTGWLHGYGEKQTVPFTIR